MADHAFAALYVLFVWWFSTGAVLYVVGLPRRSFRWTLLTASGLLAAALHLLDPAVQRRRKSVPEVKKGIFLEPDVHKHGFEAVLNILHPALEN